MSGILKRKVDWTGDMPPAGDQGHQESCVAWAIAYDLKSFEEHVAQGWSLVDGTGRADENHVFSPAFVYNQLDGAVDGGLVLSQALDFVQQHGVATWAMMPWNEQDVTSPPSSKAVEEALRFTLGAYQELTPLDVLAAKTELQAHVPVIIGVIVDSAMYYALPGDFLWRRHDGPLIAQHAMLIVGYDDDRNAFRVLNSWGSGWGDHGYLWLDYTFFSEVVTDAYVVFTRVVGAPEPITTTAPPDSEPFAGAKVTITNLAHDVPTGSYGEGIRLDGTLNVPPDIVGTAQVEVRFYYDPLNNTTGPPVISAKPEYATPRRFAATASALIPVSVSGTGTTWNAFMPYWAFGVPHGGSETPVQTNLLAEPILFINGIAARTGRPTHFFVRF
jgi:hypothetical protein